MYTPYPIAKGRLTTSVGIAITLAACIGAGEALAWGAAGHGAIAQIAAAHLTPQARSQIGRLLSLESGATLTSISTWADDNRTPTTAAWHFVNFPRNSCTYNALRDCPDGQCVIAAIDRQAQVLASHEWDETRLLALKYVVHLVGDVHQPLHAGYADDRGGNAYQLQAFDIGTNLHALWDTGLLRNLQKRPELLAATMSLEKADDISMARAAEESCQIVALPGFYPSRKLDDAYVERFTPIAENRLRLAGVRLAGLLNRIFP